MATTMTFAQAGAVFNDATRLLEGGLWQSATNEGGQGLGSAGAVVNDLHAVQASLQAQIDAGQFTGATLATVQGIATNLQQEAIAAEASVNGGGQFGSVAAAETALRNLHLGVLDAVRADATLSGLAAADGGTGFQPVPDGFAPGVNAQNAPKATLADIGAIFNDAANKMIGGVNADNAAAIKADINAARVGLEHLIKANPDDFSGLTGLHAETVVRQLQLESKYIDQAATNPVAGRGSNDNMLDIIDIVQGDETLAGMANQNGQLGFAPFPDKLNPTPQYHDNVAQTNFWANFIAQSNSLGADAVAAVGSGDRAATAHLIQELRTFEKQSASFDAAQGGIFGARFDNELARQSSTLGAEVDAMIKGLKTGDAVLVGAAAETMHANAADVGGNNLAVDGKAYNTDGLTAAEVRGLPAGTPLPGIPGAPAPHPGAGDTPEPANPGVIAHGHGRGNGRGQGQEQAGDHGFMDAAGAHELGAHQQHHVDHFGHMWA